MVSQKQRAAAKRNLKKARAKWKRMSHGARKRAMPNRRRRRRRYLTSLIPQGRYQIETVPFITATRGRKSTDLGSQKGSPFGADCGPFLDPVLDHFSLKNENFTIFQKNTYFSKN